jgi:hypothetical protein
MLTSECIICNKCVPGRGVGNSKGDPVSKLIEPAQIKVYQLVKVIQLIFVALRNYIRLRTQ